MTAENNYNKRMKQLVVIDTLSYDSFHETFNASTLKSLSIIADEIVYYSCKSSREATMALLINEVPLNIIYKTIPVVETEVKSLGVIRFILSALLNLFLLIKIDRKHTVIYLNNNPISLIGCNLISKIKNQKVVVFAHGELELLETNPRFFKPSYLYKYFLELQFNKISFADNFKLIVLGSSILNNTLKYTSSNNKTHIFSVKHPCIIDSNNESKSVKSEIIRIGTTGTISDSKGLGELLNIANRLKEYNNVKFVACGNCRTQKDTSSYNNIRFSSVNGTFVSTEDYQKSISELDYVLFLYPNDSYRFTASGALFDAVLLQKPIIALRNNYFQSFFDEGYKIGYLCDTVEDVINVIRKLANQNDINLNNFHTNISRLKNDCSYLSISADIKNII